MSSRNLLAFLVCLCAFQLFIRRPAPIQHLCNRFNLWWRCCCRGQRTKRVVGEMTKWILVAHMLLASTVQTVIRNTMQKEWTKNAEAQSVRFTFDDVNIDGLHYSILIRRAGEAKCAFISTTGKIKLDFSEDLVLFFAVAPNSVCGFRSVPNTESCLFHLSMQRRQMHLRRLAAQQLANKYGTYNKKCKHKKMGDFLSAIKSVRNEMWDGEKPENQSVAAKCSFWFCFSSCRMNRMRTEMTSCVYLSCIYSKDAIKSPAISSTF